MIRSAACASYFAVATGVEVNPPFELDNRGKRSIGLDYSSERGRRCSTSLLAQADVFVTNLRVDALEQAGLDHATLRARHPRFVYASVTGLGLEGDERGRAGLRRRGVLVACRGRLGAARRPARTSPTSAAGWATT